MTPTIKEQKDLMQQALKKLDEIETIRSLIKPIDPITYKVMVLELEMDYADICGHLFTNFLIVKKHENE